MIGSTFFGTFYLNQSPTKPSTGTEIVQPNFPSGYLVSSSISLNAVISTDSENFYPANQALYLQAVNPPCGAAGERLHVRHVGTSVVLSWWNPSYTLEGTVGLNPPTWVPIPGTSPIVLGTSEPYQYYRVSCD